MSTNTLSDIFEDYNNKSLEELCPVFKTHIFERQDTQFISQQVVEDDYVCICGIHKYVYRYLEESEL